MKILFASSECDPFAKVGGLADVVGSLPMALNKLGFDVRVFLPKYDLIDPKKNKFKLISFFSFKKQKIKIYRGKLPNSNVLIYLIEDEKYLVKNGIYKGPLFFNIKKFLFFSELILEALPRISFQPDIIHCHDWHSAALTFLLKIKKFPRKGAKTLLTIHNLPHQGEWTPGPVFRFLGLKGNELKTLKIKDKSGDFNILQQGVLNADFVTTVSPAYAKEILSPEYGEELYENFRKRKKDLYGIINGINIDLFNPEKDQNLKENYSAKNFGKKIKNKIELQKKLKLEARPESPLFCFISRLADQKGIDLIEKNIKQLLALKAQIVFLGTGEKKYEKMLSLAAKKYPRNVSANIKFDSALAQKIYAGSDIILIPSLFEPCGLIQMIAQRYGTIPIARKTGGLKNTIENGKTGFLFQEYSSKALLAAIKKCLKAFENKKEWSLIIKKAMEKDFSWQKSAKEYSKLYKKMAKQEE